MKNKIIEHFQKYNSIISQIDLERYIDFCLSKHVIKKELGKKYENHHILPKSLFPEYVNLKQNRWNCSTLSIKDHFIAHYLLSGAVSHNSTLVSLQLMARVFTSINEQDIEPLSKLYEERRILINKALSEMNKGKTMSPEQRKLMSERTKNKACYNDKYGNTFFLMTNDPRVISGEFVHIRVGYTHKDSTIKLMCENGIKDKRVCTNGVETKYISKDENLPDGFTWGRSPEFSIKASASQIGKKCFYNPITNENIKLDINFDKIPDGFVVGRSNYGKSGNPFSGKKMLKRFKTGETLHIACEEETPRYYVNPAVKQLIIYKNYIGSINAIAKFSGFDVGFISFCVKYPNKKINSKTKNLEIKNKYYGKLISDFGFTCVDHGELGDSHDKLIWLS